MRLSTSSFRASVALLVLAASVWLSCEALAVYGHARTSKIQQRILGEARAAQELRVSAAGRRTILFVGNSLFLEGVDFSRLAADSAAGWSAHRFVIEATAWYDWYYGLRRLFRGGMRADYVVLSLSPPQLASPGIRPNFSAHYLFDWQDIWSVARDTHASATAISGLYLARLSPFYGTRIEMRTALMGRINPHLFDFWQDLTVVEAGSVADTELTRKVTPRFRELRQLCSEYQVKCAVLIPPTLQSGEAAVVQAGERAGVPVLHPIHNYSLGPEFYRNGPHLNAAGAALFTKAIEDEMAKLN